MTLPRTVRLALTTERDGLLHSIPLDDYLTARREDRTVTERLSALYLLELLEAAADRLDNLQLPTVPTPTEVRARDQCASALMIEGSDGVSRCLRLEHAPDDAHVNGDLRWLERPTGEIQAWWYAQPWAELTLGQLIRDQGITLQLPHLPAGPLQLQDGIVVGPPEAVAAMSRRLEEFAERQLPQLSAPPLEAEPDITFRFTGKSTPVIEATPDPQEDQP